MNTAQSRNKRALALSIAIIMLMGALFAPMSALAAEPRGVETIEIPMGEEALTAQTPVSTPAGTDTGSSTDKPSDGLEAEDEAKATAVPEEFLPDLDIPMDDPASVDDDTFTPVSTTHPDSATVPPLSENHFERPEIPLGEEAMAAVHGTEGTEAEYDPDDIMDVTLPAAIGLHMDAYGYVTCQDDLKIVNYSTRDVKVAKISVENGWDWKLTAYSTDMSSEKVDSNQLALSLTCYGGLGRANTYTVGKQILRSEPDVWYIVKNGGEMSVECSAKMTAVSEPVEMDLPAANLTLTITWGEDKIPTPPANIVFLDADNTVIGELNDLKANTNISSQVESYVKNNLFAPSLWTKDVNSTDANACYVGGQPQYPLTNKKAMGFVVREIKTAKAANTYVIQEWSSNAQPVYRYIYGWAQCTEENFERIDTEIGRGDLADANATAFVYGGSEDFKIADLFSGLPSGTTYLKAIYQPTSTNEKYNSHIPEHYTTVTIVDWDNSLLGCFAIDLEGDNRAELNNYIEKNFIHPYLREADPNSIERADNYYGTDNIALMNRAMAKAPLKVSANNSIPATDYPLTSHLDYAFVKKPLTQTGKNTWVQADSTDEYPYTHGWAVIEKSAYADDTWTTLGVGELASWDGKRVTYEPPAHYGSPKSDITTDTASYPFRPIGSINDIAEEVVQKNPDALVNNYSACSYYLKAIYQPGPDLKDADYTPDEDDSYVAKGTIPWSVSDGGDFTFDYQFSRKTTINGRVYGVKRCRKPFFDCIVYRWEKGDAYLASSADITTYYEIPYWTSILQTTSCAQTSRDVLNASNSTSAPQMFKVAVYDYYDVCNPVQRSQYLSSGSAGSWRDDRPMTDDGRPIYSLMSDSLELPATAWGATYYAMRPPHHSMDLQMNDLILRAATEQQGLSDTTNYLGFGADILNKYFQSPVGTDYYVGRYFNNSNMDIYTQCIWSWANQVATLHPDTSDDTWWRTVHYDYASEHGGLYIYIRDDDGHATLNATTTSQLSRTARVPRLSYHQLMLYWQEFRSWYMDGNRIRTDGGALTVDGTGGLKVAHWTVAADPTLPAPLSADEADSIYFANCTLESHSSHCGSAFG